MFRIDLAGTFSSVFVGGYPSSLTPGRDGAVYGMRSGPFPYNGEVFRIDGASTVTTLHSFDPAAEGCGVGGPLSLGSDGSLYGATAAGGEGSLGTLFRIDTAGGFSSLHSFSQGEGGPPGEAMVVGIDGGMYGTTPGLGSFACHDTVFRIGQGAVFRIDASGAFTLLHSFSGGGDGGRPRASLLLARDGALYGSTERGGSSDRGTIFRVLPSGEFESVHSFTGADGAGPFTALVQGVDGWLYGTAPEGGHGGGGVVYRVFVPLPQTIVFDPLLDRSRRRRAVHGERHGVVWLA